MFGVTSAEVAIFWRPYGSYNFSLHKKTPIHSQRWKLGSMVRISGLFHLITYLVGG